MFVDICKAKINVSLEGIVFADAHILVDYIITRKEAKVKCCYKIILPVCSYIEIKISL
jgi:hypothetical protein